MDTYIICTDINTDRIKVIYIAKIHTQLNHTNIYRVTAHIYTDIPPRIHALYVYRYTHTRASRFSPAWYVQTATSWLGTVDSDKPSSVVEPAINTQQFYRLKLLLKFINNTAQVCKDVS